MRTISKHIRHDDLLSVGLVGGLVVAAWWSLTPLAAIVSGETAHHHHGPTSGMGVSAGQVGFFVASWTAMTIAMMLPASLPLIRIFNHLASEKRFRIGLVALLIAGYLVVWALFGLLVDIGLIAAPAVARSSRLIDRYAWAGSGLMLLVAGLYQFTPLKHRCLEKCRSPLSFVVQHWRGRREAWHAFRLGLHHGLFCVGCCWTLMLLMVGAGLGSLAWMLVLGAVMAIEKNVSWGRHLSAPLGAGLITWAAVALWAA